MDRTEALSIGDLIIAFCKENNIEKPLLEKKIQRSWRKLMGENVYNFTRSIQIKNDTLYLYISNAALKQQLFENRMNLIKKINEFAGISLIKNVRIFG